MRRNRQLGVTALGWLFLLTPVRHRDLRGHPPRSGVPELHESGARARRHRKELQGGASSAQIKAAIDKHFEIDMVNYPDSKDFKITRDEGVWLVEAQYDDEAPLFDNISLHVAFDKKVRIGGGGAGAE